MTQPQNLGSFQLMKLQNKSQILDTIRTDGPISRAEVAKQTHLTPPTVTNLVSELIYSGLVIEGSMGTSTGGRKPILLTINYAAFQIIGMDIGISNIKIVVTNLKGQLLDQAKINMPASIDKEAFLQLIARFLEERMTEDWGQPKQILGIGVGMHGLVDPEQGISIFAPNLKLRQIPIREYLEARFQLPVYVENDAMAMALGERWFGEGMGTDHFISVNIGMGVGAGIYLNGELYRGTTNSAGEIGHTVIDLDGELCSCGNIGCLQTIITGPAIAKKATNLMLNHQASTSLLHKLSQNQQYNISGEDVHEAAVQGDSLAQDILRGIGTHLGIGLANLTNTLNPQKIILGGGVSRSSEFFMASLRNSLYSRVLETSKHVEIVVTQLGEYATAIGAATIVLQVTYSKNNPILLENI
jgi:glucokinase-like ROK family protein